MKKTYVAVALGVAMMAGSVAVGAQAPAQPRPPQGFAAFLQAQYATIKRVVVASADKMPEADFAFKPVPEVRSYGQLIGHIAEANYSFCTAVKGGPNPAAGKKLEALVTKAEFVQAIKDSFAFCDDAFEALTDASALEMIKVGVAPDERQIARANQLTFAVAHGNEHYGNLVTYMRLKGIVPPSSTPQ